MKKKTSLVKYDLGKMADTAKMAKELKAFIVKNKLSVNILGNDYVMVEGWQFAGGLMGLFSQVVSVKELSPNKWLAKVEVVDRRTDKVMGRGFALCSKSEKKKSTFDEYAILSMAQTRATGKAFRIAIGWVMKLAGYEGTPAEDIKVDGKEVPEVAVDKSSTPKLDELKERLEGNTIAEKLTNLNKLTGTGLKSFNSVSEDFATRLIGSILKAEIKNKHGKS